MWVSEGSERCLRSESAVACDTVTLAPILAAQEAGRQRPPGRDAQATLTCHRHMLAFDAALDERVLGLQRDGAWQAMRRRQGGGLGDVPGRCIREPEVADLAGAHQVTQRLQHFFDRSDQVPGMHPVQVDVVGAQPPQRSVERAVHVLAAIACGVHVACFAAVEAELGGHYDPVAQLAFRDARADQLFAAAIRVHVGGVDEVATSVDVSIEDGSGSVVARAPVRVAKGHGAERQGAHDQA